MKSFFYTSDGRFRSVRSSACFCLFTGALLLSRWGWRYPSWLGFLLMSLAMFLMSQVEEAPEPKPSKWLSPIFWAGQAVAILGITFIGGWLTPEKLLTPSTVIIAVAVLSFTAGRAFRGWQQRVK